MQTCTKTTLAIALSAIFTSSYAADDKVDLGKIDVTGSHIKRVDTEGPSPVLTIKREDIERSGYTTVSELLRNLSISNGEAFNENYIASFAPGSSGINLRGLGMDKTLVLINGRRVAKFAFASELTDSFVDLNSIPLGAVERIEIQKDGASAIYGSDAIAGVVNIILRENYEGSEVSVSRGFSGENDATERRFSFIDGVNNDKGNITVVLDYHTRDEVGRADRSISASADHTSQPQGQDFTSPTFPDANVLDTVNPFPANILEFNGFYDPNPDFSLIPETERFSAMINLNRDINSNISLFGQFMYTQVETHSFLSPSDVFGDLDGVIVPAGQAFNPFGQDVFPYWRATELGRRTLDVETDNHRLVAGLEGVVADWEWDAALNFNRTQTIASGQNYINRLALIDAINNDLIDALGNTPNDPDALDSIRAEISRKGVSEIQGIDIKTTGEVAETDAGPVAVAIGGGRFTETLTDTPDSLSNGGQILGVGTTSSSGERDVHSLFVEVNVPLTDDLEMQVAARHEQYSDFGNSTNPKVALRYQPNDSVLIRGSYGTGFRAPSLAELNIGQSVEFDFLIDSGRCNATADPNACSLSEYTVVYQGNPDLDAEESESGFLGAVFEPIKDFTIGVDYWQFKNTNVIENNAQFILDNEASFPGQVFRLPGAGADPGAIDFILADFVNIAEQETNGVDIELKYKHNVPGFGTIMFVENLTHILSFKQKVSDTAGFEDLEGTYRYPELRSTTTLAVSRKNSTTSVTANYIGNYDGRFNGRFNAFGGTDRHKMGSFVTWDVQYIYTGFKSVSLIFGIDNLKDTAPPFSNSEIEGFDFATHNPIGRFYYGRLRYDF